MGNEQSYLWKLHPNPDKPLYQPKDNIIIHFNVENLLTNEYLYISKILASTSWFTTPFQWEANNQLSPRFMKFLKCISIPIPESETGVQKLRFGLNTWIWKENIKKWISLGDIYTDKDYEINITPYPIYKAFISRSNRIEDTPIVEPIVGMIRNWGFETKTVGINIFAKESKKIPHEIIDEIITSDCLIAVATPRDRSAIDGFWKTLVWLHSEVSFAFLLNKPIIIFMDERVKKEGLIITENMPVLSFSILDYRRLSNNINQMMPKLRKAISDKKAKNFNNTLTSLFKRIALAPEVFFLGYSSGKSEE